MNSVPLETALPAPSRWPMITVPSPSPSPALAEILRVDPVADNERITRLITCYEFPFEMTRALEPAFFQTLAVPRIATLLASPNEFALRSQRRTSSRGRRPAS